MGSSSRLFTKPVITINLDCDGAAVILGRAETIRNSNAPTASACDDLATEIERVFTDIQVLVEIRANAPAIYMSRTAQRITGLSVAEMTEAIAGIQMSL